ncbi:MAG: hypothetical protein OXG84_09020 [Chloroflexi bacterium]|nr:hypothetical protein [Chloroflexota bacterium]
MYNIYHFFAFLINVRSELSSVTNLQDYHFNSAPLAYRDNASFPSLVLRMHKGYSSPGGEFVGIMDSESYNVPPFESHIPTGALSLDTLGHDLKAKIYKSMQAAGEVPGWIREREVYYLIRGRNNGNSKICLVHGSFFENRAKPEYFVREALEEVLADFLKEQTLNHDQFNMLCNIFAQETFADQFRQVSIGRIKFSLGIKTRENLGANLLSSFYYPQIKDNTLNFVIPHYPEEKNAHRMQKLRWTLSVPILKQCEKIYIKHPQRSDYSVLSYAL